MCYCLTAKFRELPIYGNEPIWRSNNKDTPNENMVDLAIQRPWCTGACLWTRDAIDAVGPWADLRYGEDAEYDFRASLRGVQFIKLPEVLFYYRRSKTGDRLTQKNEQRRINNAYATVKLAKTAVNYSYKLNSRHVEFVVEKLKHSILVFLLLGRKMDALECVELIKKLRSKNFLNRASIIFRRFWVRMFPDRLAYYIYQRSRLKLPSSTSDQSL